MTEPIPYADYVRIEVRVGGKTRTIEFESDDILGPPEIRIKPLDRETDVLLFGAEPSRSLPSGEVAMSFEVRGPQATIGIEETR
jgi:hypothetical protein